MCFDFLYNWYLKYFSFYEHFREILSYVSKRLYVGYPVLFADFNETCIFSTDFRNKAQISSFTKIIPVGAELFHTDGRTDTTKLTVACRNFANAPEECASHKNDIFWSIR